MLFPGARLLLFAKAPEPGGVKTRLIPALGESGAADLYARMLRQQMARVSQAGIAPVECCCAPRTEHPFFRSAAAEFGLQLSLQRGRDLGARMARPARRCLRLGTPVLLIGGDAPALEPRHMIQALEWLYADADAVVAPAEDGGYVMLGLRRFDASLFSGIAWGGDGVLATTRRRLQALGWRWRETETLWDLDRPADLERLARLEFNRVR